MIQAYIPTCNRACQLHLLLESVERNCPNTFDFTISYKATNQKYLDGYTKLASSSLGSKYKWIPQEKYGVEWMHFLRENKGDIVGHFVDDSIFYRKTVISEDLIRYILSSEIVWCFNFRVGLNISITDYQTQKAIDLPQNVILIDDKYIVWNYREEGLSMWDSYFAFEGPVDGFVFRAENILWMCEDIDYSKWRYPLDYEDAICHTEKRNIHNKNVMAAPIYSEVFAQHINSSAGLNSRNVKGLTMNIEQLNEKYIDGYVIDLNSMDFSNINCAHDEIPFEMKRL